MPKATHASPSTTRMSRAAATRFASKWASSTGEKQRAQSYWRDFFMDVCGVPDLLSAGIEFEYPIRSTQTNTVKFIDVFWPGVLLIEHKSKGKNLDAAHIQAAEYVDSLAPALRPAVIICSDFGRIRITEIDGDSIEFPVADLPQHLHRFEQIVHHRGLGSARVEAVADKKAARLMADLYKELARNGYEGHDTSVLLTRLLFLMFGDDTEMWPQAGPDGLLLPYLDQTTRPDGSDTGPALRTLFEVLDTHPDRRQAGLHPLLRNAPYVNGGLFARSDAIHTPVFDQGMRTALVKAAQFNWGSISPAVFGSLFQSVKSKEDRHAGGEHYTSEENILKVIRPLFLDDLTDQMWKAWDKPKVLGRLRDSLATKTYLDPACGCGNFLVVAYREMRNLELKMIARLQELGAISTALTLDGTWDLKVRVDQFHGIEIDEWPAQIARTAMFLADHQANLLLDSVVGNAPARLPIQESANIVHANALEVDWASVCTIGDATLIMGNPPFLGIALLSSAQQQQARHVYARNPFAAGLPTGRLDFAGCWLTSAIEHLTGTRGRAAFVTTNSITQGEQARAFGSLLQRAGFKIDFAYRTFSWSNEAPGRAAVHVVIAGFSSSSTQTSARLYEDDGQRSSSVKSINAYLLDSEVVAVGKHTTPFVPVPRLTEGNRPQDGGGLIVSAEERAGMLTRDPVAAKYLRRLVGAKDMLSGDERWCLWLTDATPSELRASPALRARMETVRAARLGSPTQSARQKAATPALFLSIRQPASAWLCVPRVSSERRAIVPMAYFTADDIAHDTTLAIDNAPLWLFGVLQSRPWTTWVRAVAGRMKSDLRVSPDICYNAFPWPDLTDASRGGIEGAAASVLAVRKEHSGSSLADLYDPLFMPHDLVAAHAALDAAVLKAYNLKASVSDHHLLSTLFGRYATLTGIARS